MVPGGVGVVYAFGLLVSCVLLVRLCVLPTSLVLCVNGCAHCGCDQTGAAMSVCVCGGGLELNRRLLFSRRFPLL